MSSTHAFEKLLDSKPAAIIGYWIGRYSTLRDGWIEEARRNVDARKICVQTARGYNRQLVKLRSCARQYAAAMSHVDTVLVVPRAPGRRSMRHADTITLYTIEDCDVWFFLRSRIQRYRPGYTKMRRIAREGDRRDADLMLSLKLARDVCDQQGVLHCILAGHHTALDGYEDPEVSLVELGLAMRIPKLPGRYR